ncbi:MAG: zinc finger domain-containing protein [Terriglobales bacterium]
MRVTDKEIMAVQCPLCLAKPGKKCKRLSGEPCFELHQERRWVAVDKKIASLNR